MPSQHLEDFKALAKKPEFLIMSVNKSLIPCLDNLTEVDDMIEFFTTYRDAVNAEWWVDNMRMAIDKWVPPAREADWTFALNRVLNPL